MASPIEVSFNLDISQGEAVTELVTNIKAMLKEMQGVAGVRVRQPRRPQDAGSIMAKGLGKLIPGAKMAGAFKQLGMMAGIATAVVGIAAFVKGIFNSSIILSTFTSTFMRIFGLMADMLMMPFIPLIVRVMVWFIQEGMPFARDLGGWIKTNIIPKIETIATWVSKLDPLLQIPIILSGLVLTGIGVKIATAGLTAVGTLIGKAAGLIMAGAFAGAVKLFQLVGTMIAASFAAAQKIFQVIGGLMGQGFAGSSALKGVGKAIGIAAVLVISYELGKMMQPYIDKVINLAADIVDKKAIERSLQEGPMDDAGFFKKLGRSLGLVSRPEGQIPAEDIKKIAEVVASNPSLRIPSEGSSSQLIAAVIQSMEAQKFAQAQRQFTRLNPQQAQALLQVRPGYEDSFSPTLGPIDRRGQGGGGQVSNVFNFNLSDFTFPMQLEDEIGRAIQKETSKLLGTQDTSVMQNRNGLGME